MTERKRWDGRSGSVSRRRLLGSGTAGTIGLGGCLSSGNAGERADRASTVSPAATAQPTSAIRWVAPDGDLQAAVDAVAGGSGKVVLEPGVHASHDYPITVPNGVTIQGFGRGSTAPGGGEVYATQLDAGGGVALDVTGETGARGDRTLATAIHLENFSAVGTIRFGADINRDFTVRNVLARDATTEAGPGRGLEITGSAFLYDVENFWAHGTDGAGVYVTGDGQAHFEQISTFGCGESTDGMQQYYSSVTVGGGEGAYYRLIAGDPGEHPGGGTDGIVFDGCYSPTLYAPQIESHDGDNLVFEGEAGKDVNASVNGGRIFGAGRDNVAIGRSGKAIGVSISEVFFGTEGQVEDSGVDVHCYGSSMRCLIGPNKGRTGGGFSIGNFTVNNDGFQNHLAPVNRELSGDPSDLTSVAGQFYLEQRFHDGNGSLPPGPAYWHDGNWRSIVDGSTVAP